MTCTRLLDARPVVDGGRDHASHRLVAIGLSEGQAVAVLWALAAAAGGSAWTVARLEAGWPVLTAAACVDRDGGARCISSEVAKCLGINTLRAVVPLQPTIGPQHSVLDMGTFANSTVLLNGGAGGATSSLGLVPLAVFPVCQRTACVWWRNPCWVRRRARLPLRRGLALPSLRNEPVCARSPLLLRRP